jgi:carbon-monoxide dehydrogenase small subunit
VTTEIELEVNGRPVRLDVEPRELLLDVLRTRLGLTGTHAGCEQGACGTCTVLMDGFAVRSCLMFAVQADGKTITTIEGVAPPDRLHPVQQALCEHHGLQCGFCTPGMVLAAIELLQRTPTPTREEVELAMSGNLCRCTGYVAIVDAIEAAAAALRGSGAPAGTG